MVLFIGVDLGTQGVRTVATDEKGKIVANSNVQFDVNTINGGEQDVNVWRNSIYKSLSTLSDNLGRAKYDVLSISVTSTSGTILPVDRNLEPIYNAIMYHNNVGAPYLEKLENEKINKSFSQGKVLWFQSEKSEHFKKTYKFIHANDYIILLLTGDKVISDYSSALKSGYDVLNNKWDDSSPSLQLSELFPEVLKTGTIVGNISRKMSDETGLPCNIKVVLGMTDGCTSLLSTGCSEEGDWCTTIGTTMVIKGLSENYIKDDVFYSHKHPDGLWMPGGASNIGAKWISYYGFNNDIKHFNSYAEEKQTADQFHYPLIGTGERFPFQNKRIKGFDNTIGREESYLAGLEGVAYIERMAYEKLEKEYEVNIKKIYSSGSAGHNEVWNRIRSNVLKKPLVPASNAGSAFGAAMIAASTTYYESLKEASKQMNPVSQNIIQDTSMAEQYDEKYLEFKKLLEKE